VTVLEDNDAVGLAALVRNGEVSPRELVAVAIERIEAVDPLVNSVIHRQFERATQDASGTLPNGPFRGVPFLMKDFGGQEAGEPHHRGMRALRDAGWRAPADSPFARRVRAIGLIPLGRTNVPELALMGTTEPDAYGPTRNPWDLSRSPGGSSGGSAAAVAARMVPAAHANDIAGSIRIPSAQCGLVGLKPTRGRVVIGDVYDPPVGMHTEGVVTRSMRDAATLVDALTDCGNAGPWPAPALPGPLAAEVGRDPGQLRVGVCRRAFNDADVEAGCVEAAVDAACLLERLGHHVEDTLPAGLFEPDLLAGARFLTAVHAAADLEACARRLGRVLDESDVEPTTWSVVEAGRLASAVDVVRVLARQQQLSREILSWWRSPEHGGFDLLLTPTTAEPAPRLGAYKSGFTPGRGSAFTRPFNVTGQPALSVPLGWPDDGLPRGVQLIAGYGREDVLVRVGAQLEAAAPWFHRRPPIG
jgi:amidase